MRPINEMSTVQIELTDACVLACSNCTRFSGTPKTPFFLSSEDFRAAIDSLIGFAEGTNGIIGFMGGEPLLHPKFEEFCDYALTKIKREKLGLWTTFPPKFKRYREVIARTFGNILLNDHSRDDILHAPVLVAAEDVFDNDADIFVATERCWVQESWSAAVNPKGAWFCEVAAALSNLFDGPQGWPVEKDWWKRTTKDYTAQREWACRKCGAALPLARIRNSQDETDDVSKSNLERLKEIKSRKVAKGGVSLREEPFQFDRALVENHGYPAQTYKDHEYRQRIAAKYDMYLKLNAAGFWEPRLMEDGGFVPTPPKSETPSLFSIMSSE